MKQVFVNIAQFLVWVQQTVIALLRQIPGSEQVEAIAEGVTRPIRGLAAFFLRKFPWLKRWEWLLEIERLQKIHPVMLMVLLAFVFYRGLQTTYLGHIATDRMIYPFLGAISYFNPFLGILSAVTFGVGDLIQKLIYNDIYGSAATGGLAVLGAFGDGNYWGGVAGYCLAYSSIVVAGLLPGMLARVFRLAVRKTLALLFFRKAAATADGAKYGEPGKGPAGSTAGGAGAPAGGSQAGASGGMGSLMPGGTEPVYPMAEFLASILGAGVGGALTMGTLAPTLEKPAFYLRPNPDVSCHDMEVATYLKRPAFREGLSGPAIGGPLISGLMPLTGPVVEEAPPESDESPGPDDPRDGDGPEDAGPEDGPDDGGLFGEEPDVDWETTVEWDLAKDGPLTDPETGEELLVHDGNYEGGEPGQVWYKGEWMDAADAALLIHRWEEALERDRQAWYDRETRRWQDDVRQKAREDGYDFDRYRDAWRKPPPPAEFLEIPPEDPDVLKLQRRKGDPGFWHRMLIGPSDVGYEKLDQRLNQLDTMESDLLNRYRDLRASQNAAEEAGDKWLAEHYKSRRETELNNFRRLRDAKFDLTGRVTDSSEGGRKHTEYIRKNQTITGEKVWQAGREMFWDPIRHVFKPNLADKNGDGPLGTSFKKLKAASDAMRLRAKQMPGLDAQFRESMDAIQVYRDELVEAVRRDDAVAIKVLEQRIEAERHRAVSINHLRGDLANRTRDWEVSAARVTAQYYQTQMDRAGSAQMQYQAARAGSRIAARVTGAFSADAPVIRSRSIKGEAEAWDRLHKQHPEEFRQIRQKMAGDAGGAGGGGGGGGLSKYDQMLDRQFTQRQMVAGRKVARWNDNHVRLEQAEMRLKAAQQSGNPQEISEAMAAKLDAERRVGRAVNRGLSDPHVKMQMKKAPSDVQHQWGVDAQRYRTDPVRRTTVDIINKEKPWVVETAPGKYRRLTPDDLEPVSSHGKAGMDLDLNPNSRIIDTRTGRRVTDTQLQGTVNQACKKLRIDAGRQDIHVVSSGHPAAYRVPEGMDPKDALRPEYVRDTSPTDGEHMHRVAEWKRTQETGGDLSAKCYHAQKDYKRFTEPMLERHPTASRPKVFSDEAMKIMDDVGNHRMAPGTGNARFKQLTGMDLDEGCRKLNSMQQSVPALDSPGRRIEIARSRAASAPTDTSIRSGGVPQSRAPGRTTFDGPEGGGAVVQSRAKPAPIRSEPDLRSLVGDTGPTLKTPGGQKLNEYLQKRDIRSFVDADGNVHGFGRKPTPEVTNTKAAIEARARAAGAGERGAVGSGTPFEELLDDARGQNPTFKAAHDKVKGAIMEANDRRIAEVRDLHVDNMKAEGVWGDPSSPGFQSELDHRIGITPLDDPRAVALQQRTMYERGVTESEFDLYIDGRAKIRRGEPLGPVEPLKPQDPTRSPHYVDVDRRYGAPDPSVETKAPPPVDPMPDLPEPVTPDPGPPAGPGSASHPPPAGTSSPPPPPSPDPGPAVRPQAPPPDPVPDAPAPRPDDLRPDAARPEAGRPETTRPEYTRPEASRPLDLRPDGGHPDVTRPEAIRPEASRPESTVPDAPLSETVSREFEVPEFELPDFGESGLEGPDTGQPEWLRPEPPRSRFYSRFFDFFPDEPEGGA